MTMKFVVVKFFDKVFRGSDRSVIIGQSPNLPIIGWAIAKIIAVILMNQAIGSSFDKLSFGFIFLWAYLEIRDGANIFRRILGTFVMVVIIISLF